MQRVKFNFVTVLTVLVAFLMIAPATILVADNIMETSVAQSAGEDYYTVIFHSDFDEQALMQEKGLDIVKIDSWGAVIKTTESTKKEIGKQFSVSEMPDRTRVKLMEVGLEFDSRLGYEVPARWRADGSELYLVQFVAPLETSWLDEIKGHSTSFFDTIGDNLAVVKLSPQQKETVASLSYVEWLDTYQPYFKVYQNAREQTGEFMIKATPMGASIEELAQQMTLLGALDVELNDGCSMVEATVTDLILPDIAKLESVAMIQYYPEMVQQGSMSGEIVGAHCAWDVTRSNLPQAIRGEGQVYQHQDLGIDASHQDFTMGPLGDRLIYAESSTDSNSHSTTCVGMAAGNGYDMEGWLGQGLDNMDRNYYDMAPTNPQGFLDRVGFAGRAPETGIVSYNGLLTSEWDDGYTTYGARVFSNSFGPGPVTQGYTNDGDVFMTAYPEGLIVFCMCNYGPNEMTGSGICNGKMNLGVGAVENNRGDWFQSDDNPFQIWASSSKGPVSPSDLRVKPDVVEFGAGIISCKSDDSSDDANTIYRGGENNAAWLVNYDPDARGDYAKNQGTSFSSPAAAGDCILIRDYLEDIKGIAIPDPILIKTYLIHGAQDMGYGFPSYGQGWGLCNIEYSICPPAPLTNVYWEGTASDSWTIDVNSAGAPLKVTMSHWDSGTASGTLTTDYDVVVTSPTGKRYEGNAFAESISTEINVPADWSGCAFPSWAQSDGIGSGPYDWDTADDGGDDINTVEVCLIDNPEKGIWTVDVDAKSGAGPSWFVVASADFGPVDSYNVEMEQDANLVYSMSDGYGTCAYQASPGDTVAVGFTVQNFGTNADTIDLAATRQDYGYGVGSPIPAGWTVTYDTGSSLAMSSEDIVHVTAYVTTSGTAAEGTYALKVTGSSTNSVIAQDYIIFNVDIIDQRLPDRVRVTDHPLADMSPGVAAWNDGGTEYVVVSYQHDTGMGERVWVSVSSDGGLTFGDPVKVTSEADDPQYLNLKVAPAGHDYEGRMFISYNSMQPLLSGYNWDEVSNRRCMMCYADPPYTSWNVVAAFDNGEGPASFNDYRATDVGFWINPGGPDEVHLIEENYYNNADDMNSAWEDIMTAERVSMDGGATWPVTNEINTGSLNFAPAASDDSGDLILTFYESSGGRRMYYTRYTGSWGAPIVGMDFGGDDAMYGYGAGDPGSSRYFLGGYRVDGSNVNDFKIPYVSYTDNQGGTWNGGAGVGSPVGPLGGANNLLERSHFDTQNLQDMDVTTDSYAWLSGPQIALSTLNPNNPYWARNFYVAGSTSADQFSTYTDNYVTRDSFPKQHWRATPQGNDLLVAYNTYESGHGDIFLARLYNGWDVAADTLGPITKCLQAPERWNKELPLDLGANIDDISTGNSNIQAAEYRWDGGAATPLSAVDGGFDAVVEGVTASSDVSGLTKDWHYLEVRGQDVNGFWGEWEGKWVLLYEMIIPDPPTFAGIQSVVNPGTGTYLTLTWDAAGDYGGEEYDITYHIWRSTSPGLPGIVDIDTTPTHATYTPGGMNPGDPITWDDTISIVEGTTYYYYVVAKDAGGVAPDTNPLWEDPLNTAEASGTPEILIYFQVQSPFPLYRNLNTDAFEGTIQTETTAVMSAVGDYQIDAADGKWISDPVVGATSLDGLWRFYVYGQMNTVNANGFLYANVCRYSDSAVLFTTGLDDEDIVGFTGSYHQFLWDYTASGITLPDADRFYVELWIDVTNIQAPPGANVVYDYNTATPQTDCWAYNLDSDDNPPTIITSETEVTLISPTAYTDMTTSDNIWFQSNDPGTPDYITDKFTWWLAETPGEIDSIELYFEGAPRMVDPGGPEVSLYAWNDAGSSWTWVAEGDLPDVDTGSDGVVSGVLDGVTWSDYVIGANNELIWIAVYNVPDSAGQATRLNCDLVKTTVTKIGAPDGQFTFGYDNSATPSAVHQPGEAPTPDYFDIPVAAGWNFISTPFIPASTLVPGVFTDLDSDTTWTYLQHYDGADSADHWKTYNPAYPGIQDLTSVNEGMGVWINVDTVGDGFINVTGTLTSGGTIMLQQGWNMIGWPTTVDGTYTLADLKTANPGLIDSMERFDGAAAYDIVVMGDAEFFYCGSAYWINVNAAGPLAIP